MKNNLLSNSLFYIVLPVLLLAQSSTVSAIIMRHDVDREQYLLDPYNYQSAIHSGDCSATLIAPRWALTAAHCIGPEFGELIIFDEVITIKKLHEHPGYNTEDYEFIRHDIALIELQEPIYSMESTPPYEGSDELGKTLKLAGYGDLGNPVDGLEPYAGLSVLHGADNITAGVNEYLLGFLFDNPADGNSLPLEGVGGPGDSGGAAYIETSEGRFVAGVSSYGAWQYGDYDYYTRVSKELNWLKEVMNDEYPGNYGGPLYSEPKQNDNAAETITKNEGSSGGSSSSVYLLFLAIILFSRKSKVLD
ncbi:MAG: hypothetical protein ACI9LM_001587 [Alteromonadaceae bacterium]|jgi:hypothetical protein